MEFAFDYFQSIYTMYINVYIKLSPQSLCYTTFHNPAVINISRDVVSYYGLFALRCAVEVHIEVLVFTRNWQVVVVPPHHVRPLLLQAA